MPASRSTCARTSARPASRPSCSPCSKASWCASACKSARPPAVGIFGCAAPPSILGAFQSATVAAVLRLASDKLAAAFAAETDGALFRHPLGNDDDFLLCRFDVGEFHRTARFHVVLEDFRGALRHVLQDLLLYFGLGAAQCHGQGFGTHLSQQGLNISVVDFQQVVENEQQFLDLLMHLAVRFFDLAELR